HPYRGGGGRPGVKPAAPPVRGPVPLPLRPGPEQTGAQRRPGAAAQRGRQVGCGPQTAEGAEEVARDGAVHGGRDGAAEQGGGERMWEAGQKQRPRSLRSRVPRTTRSSARAYGQALPPERTPERTLGP